MPDKIQVVIIKIDHQSDQIYTLEDWGTLGRLKGFLALKICYKNEINGIEYPLLTIEEFEQLKSTLT